MKIVNIPIEPIEGRYSIQWAKWFDSEFRASGIPFTTITGTATSGKINSGSFLDVIETNKYKTEQLLAIIEELRQYDNQETLVLFFHDLWFPGLENIAYIRDGLGLTNLKICGCLHAGSYDSHDFLNKKGMIHWAKHAENAWFNIIDEVYLATTFHADLLYSKRLITPAKIKVTGFPLYDTFFSMVEKSNVVVFPHRLDAEKQPCLFTVLAEQFPETIEFVKTVDMASSKEAYYRILCGAKIAVSFALQETWGIAMQEATICGCIPLVPNRLSYTEMYLPEFLYHSEEELIRKINKYLLNPPTELLMKQIDMILTKGGIAINNMINSLILLSHEEE